MSQFPKLYIPAYELLRARYRPEEAAKVYEEMTQTEREKTDYIMELLSNKQEQLSNIFLDESLPYALIVESCITTPCICQYLRYLGYKLQSIPASVALDNDHSTVVIEW